MIKTKRNKFYIGKQEVTLFAVYLPDLLTDKHKITISILIQRLKSLKCK